METQLCKFISVAFAPHSCNYIFLNIFKADTLALNRW